MSNARRTHSVHKIEVNLNALVYSFSAYRTEVRQPKSTGPSSSDCVLSKIHPLLMFYPTKHVIFLSINHYKTLGKNTASPEYIPLIYVHFRRPFCFFCLRLWLRRPTLRRRVGCFRSATGRLSPIDLRRPGLWSCKNRRRKVDKLVPLL